MKKSYKKKKFNPITIGAILLMLSTLIITVGFSSYQASLDIRDVSAVVRVQADIRVTSVSTTSVSSEASSNWEDYNVRSISSSVNLPNEDSTITYQIQVTNFGNVKQGISAIDEVYKIINSELSSNLEIKNKTVTLKEALCDDNNSSECTLGSVTTFDVTIGYADGGYDGENITHQIQLNFDFKRIYNITYNGFTNTTGLPTQIMSGDTKDIVFNSTTGIPSSVSVSGATGTYSNPTLTISNASSNVVVYKKYSITYVLDGGVQAPGQVTHIASNESVTLLDPIKDEYHFSGWYSNPDFEGEPIKVLSNVTSDITLYAYWTEYDYFVDHAEFDGTVDNVIDTGIQLYSPENVNRNFRIKFTIDDYDSSYNTASNLTGMPTILSSMVETKSPYSGFVYRLVNNNDTSKYSTKINDSHVKSYLGYYTLSAGVTVEIVRENGIMYIKTGDDVYRKVLDYEGNIDTFAVPLTIGGNINSSGEYDRLFKGTLSDVSVEFYEGSVIEVDYNYTETKTDNSYTLTGTIEFDGNNYIDTGLNLFSEENINKDFEISLTVQQFAANIAQATLVNAKDETQNNVWPGFSYRLKGNSAFEFTARWPGETNASGVDPISTPKLIVIRRRDGVIYYSVDGTEEKKLISTPASSLTKAFVPNLTFGASLDSSGVPFRNFKGIVSNISVNLYENS